MELADDRGRVVADAELGWVEERVALLRPDQSDQAGVWCADAWTVCQLDDCSTLVGGRPWALVVASLLGLELLNSEC